MPNIKDHLRYMNLAQEKSRNFLGWTHPNPSVGCVIVDYKNISRGRIISFGVTGKSGRPHAEEVALKKINNVSKDMIMYLTLEPCFHKSRFSPCVDQIINSGIKKIFIASLDPDNRTHNKSIKKLKKNNIKVYIGIKELDTKLINRFFFLNKKLNRSYIKYKLAISYDKKIAYKNYDSKWISNKISRKFSQNLRLKSHAILTTYKTVKYDNPRLTLRLRNYPRYKNPVIILDSKLQIDINSKLIKSSKKRKIIIFIKSGSKEKIMKLKKLNCQIIALNDSYKRLNLKKILKECYKLGISDILVEAGGKLFTNMYENNLIDELHLFISPKIIGKDGLPMYLGKEINFLNKIKNKIIYKKNFGNDLYYNYNL
ncbi:MAG: riboflavin biosynthesis protein RibD [Pelagibacteraceae bacterium]|nr:riboflavin biosynthesis protein RibD [Pelagibacteraceae bacterium]